MNIEMKVSRASDPYAYSQVRGSGDKLYIFEDNPQRTAKPNSYYKIPEDSWYRLKYGNDRNLYREPGATLMTSCIRGLPNAFPLCTVGNMMGSFWIDEDFQEAYELLESDIYQIIQVAPLFSEVGVPWQGLLRTEESGITEQRCPRLYRYLVEQTEYLWWLLKMV